MLSPSHIQDLRASLRGELIEPHDDAYEEACKVYNGMIQKRPRVIVRCADVADVILAVKFGTANNLLIAVRGGGHHVGGFGTCDDGLVIDLCSMKNTQVDIRERIVTVGGGCTLGDVDHSTHAFGLATPLGVLSTTGVGGLTLGGGLGYLTRRYGLAIDNLLSVDMVLADGSFVTANAEQNADLFWAVRGGGGNFGIVTSFVFKLYPVSTVYGGPILWELEDCPAVMKWYRDYIVNASEEISGFFAFLTVPPGPPFPEHLHLKKMCAIVWAYTGALEKADDIFKPIREFIKPALDLAGPLPFPALQSMFDSLYPKGLHQYWCADFLKELPDEAIDLHKKFAEELPTMLSTVHIHPVNGAAQRINPNATAWSNRDATWAFVIVGVDPDPANNEKIISWTKAYYKALHPFSSGGAYINFITDEGEERIRSTYRDNYDRLVTIKKKYDPNNVFRVNQNIKPLSTSVSTEEEVPV